MKIVFFLFHCYFLSNVYFLPSFVKYVFYYFQVIVDFSNREIYSVGQLVDPKDRETSVQIRL